MNTALFQQEMKNIEEYAQTLCETLEENFKQDSLDSYRAMQMREGYSIYAAKRIEEIENGTANLYKYVIQKGRKYLKIVQQQFDDMGPNRTNTYKDSSVHAFIDKKTGQVYMPAGYNKPTLTGKNPVRWDLRIIKDREYILNPRNCGWAGGYLYDRSTLPNKYY